MADFSNSEKRNLSFKHVLGIAGTNNLDGSEGKLWFEESISSTHPIYLPSGRSDFIPQAANLSSAISNAQSYLSVEDRSQGEAITLVANGSDWDVTTSTVVPKVGYQITDSHPSPNYIKSITNVSDNGGGNYTITLNNNIGVSAGSAVVHSRIFLTKDPSSNEKAWMAHTIQGDFFSDRIREFISPIEFGRGYTVKLFQADGTQVNLTEGAWFFNWGEGLLIFGDGFTSSDLNYEEPLYVEGFTYSGDYGVSGSSLEVLKDGDLISSSVTSFDFGEGFSVSGSGNTALISITGSQSNLLNGIEEGDTLSWNSSSSQWEPSSELQISGSTIFVRDRLVVEGSLQLPSGSAPEDSDTAGLLGEVRFDSTFMYIHTGIGGWRRVELALF